MKKEKGLNRELFEQNEGAFDRLLRFLAGEFMLIFAYVWLNGNIVEYLFYIFGFACIFTSISGHCLLYKVFNINTNKTKEPVRETLTLLIFFYAILIPVLIIILKNYTWPPAFLK